MWPQPSRHLLLCRARPEEKDNFRYNPNLQIVPHVSPVFPVSLNANGHRDLDFV
jgi:hypothetical protein